MMRRQAWFATPIHTVVWLPRQKRSAPAASSNRTDAWIEPKRPSGAQVWLKHGDRFHIWCPGSSVCFHCYCLRGGFASCWRSHISFAGGWFSKTCSFVLTGWCRALSRKTGFCFRPTDVFGMICSRNRQNNGQPWMLAAAMIAGHVSWGLQCFRRTSTPMYLVFSCAGRTFSQCAAES